MIGSWEYAIRDIKIIIINNMLIVIQRAFDGL